MNRGAKIPVEIHKGLSVEGGGEFCTVVYWVTKRYTPGPQNHAPLPRLSRAERKNLFDAGEKPLNHEYCETLRYNEVRAG